MKQCPECAAQGVTSTVRDGGMGTTLIGWFPYYDENGSYHIHNPNRRTASYTCSRGHHWEETLPNVCPTCGVLRA